MEYNIESAHEYPQLVTANGVSAVQDKVLLLWKCVLQDDLVESRRILCELLGAIRSEICSNTGHTIDRAIYWSIFDNLFCFIAHVRDIHMGLGKRQMTYMMLDVWYDYFPTFAIKALHTIVSGTKVNHSYGSWRDICGLCEYLKKHSRRRESHPLVDTAIEMMNFALHKENMHYYHNKTEYLTNIAKWVPREKSQFKWLFQLLVIHWSQTYGQSDSSSQRQYRRMVSKLSKVINPIEQNLCAQTRDNITVDSLSNISIVKNWHSLQLSEFDDIYDISGDKGCYYLSQYFTFPEHITKLTQLGVRCIEHNGSAEEINLLNSQWSKSFRKWTKRFTVDKLSLAVIHSSSISMHDKVLCKSIAHACYIAGASDIKRILYASETPIWINLEHCDGFVAVIRTILNALRHEFISCLDVNKLDTSIDMAIQTMGEGHPFLPVVFTDSGLYSYNHSRSFYEFFSIMDSSRYRCMNKTFIPPVICNGTPNGRHCKFQSGI